MERLFATLELRATDDELREFEGIANTAAEDSHGTIVEPAGAKFELPIPLLWFHDAETPVGEITSAELRDGKWFVRGVIRKVKEPGAVKDATDKAWQSIKYKLVRGLSVGFIPLKEKGKRFIEWLWRELSLVTLPSNTEASILAVRSAFGASQSPGVSGNPTTKPRPKMTTQEKITQFENTRAAKVARKEALLEQAEKDGGRTLNESESEEFDTLETEVRSIDEHLVRLNSVKLDTEKRAVPVDPTPGTKPASDSRGGIPVIKVRSNEEKGIGFARYALSLIQAGGNHFAAAQIAEARWGDQSKEIVQLHQRAAVAAGTTTDATWAGPLAQPTNLVSEFLELLRPATILGRLQGLRNVPFNIAMPAQTGGTTAGWVGQGSAKPVSAAAFSTVTMGFSKVAAICVLSKELVKFSNPKAEAIIRDSMRDDIAAFLDVQFTDPAVAAVANVSPASITNGIAGTAASGTTEVAARADLRALLAGFITGNFGLGNVALLMNEGIAFTLGTIVNAVGEPAFPGISATGGSILGIQVVTSNAITAATGIIAVHTPSVLYAEEGLELDMSEQASLQMDSAPMNPSDATTVMVSLWQRNLIGLRAERFINWKLARATAVRRINTVAYA